MHTCRLKGQLGSIKKTGGHEEREVIVPHCPCEAPSRFLCPGLGPPAREECGAVGDGPEEDHEDDLKLGASLL